MEEKYELLANLDQETKKIYEKYFQSKKYNILINEEDIILTKKGTSKVNLENEMKIVRIIKSMISKYKNKGIIYIDLTNEFKTILNKIENKNNIKNTDDLITFPIRRAITNSIVNKYKQIDSEKDLNEIEKIMLFHIVDSTIDKGEISNSDIQEKFNLKYSSIPKILNMMYELEIISEHIGSKPRKYLLNKDEWEYKKQYYQETLKINKEIYNTCLEHYKRDNNQYRKLEETEDPLLIPVIDCMIEKGVINTSIILKEFNTGYNRAERILKQIELRNIISSSYSKNNRKFLITKEEWEKNKYNINKK